MWRIILLIIKICCIRRHDIIKKGHMTIISRRKSSKNFNQSWHMHTREIWVLDKYRVISTKIYVWTYTPGAYHLPTSIILINHNASSSYTFIQWVKEELASRIESASFASSHLGYLLFIAFFLLLSQKIEREMQGYWLFVMLILVDDWKICFIICRWSS